MVLENQYINVLECQLCKVIMLGKQKATIHHKYVLNPLSYSTSLHCCEANFNGQHCQHSSLIAC